jgi:hypothetical protein
MMVLRIRRIRRIRAVMVSGWGSDGWAPMILSSWVDLTALWAAEGSGSTCLPLNRFEPDRASRRESRSASRRN